MLFFAWFIPALASEAREKLKLSAETYVKRGLEYSSRPRPEDQAEAERLFRKALEAEPDRAYAHAGLARVYLYQYTLGLDESPERLSSALDEARRAVELAPEDAGVAAVFALALIADDHLTPALEQARRAVAAKPDLSEAQVALCVTLRLRGDQQGALQACRRAAEISPDEPRVLSALGEALREAGQYREALEMFGQAIDLDHEAMVPQLGSAATLLKAGNNPLAERLFAILSKQWDYASGRVRLGIAALRVNQQDYEEALRLYDGLEVPAGTSLPALLTLYGKGYCLKRLGRDAEAEYFFSSLLERVPVDYDGPARGREILFNSYDDLVSYFDSRGRDRKAVSLLKSACDRPLVPTRLARALAVRLEARKDPGGAAAVMEKAVLGADPTEDALELSESALKMVRLRTSNGTRRLPEASPAGRALSQVSLRLQSSDLGVAHYRLARALALAQWREAAVQSLLQARASGYLPTDQMAGEPDFETLRREPDFETLLKPQKP